MPEIAEVEHARIEAQSWAGGQVITAVPHASAPRWDSMRGAAGFEVISVGRRGKYLLMPLRRGDDELVAVLHLGMTGSLRAGQGSGPQPPPRHLRLHLQLAGRYLALDDPRGFGFARLVDPPDLQRPPWTLSTFGRLGHDPLDAAWDDAAAGQSLVRATARKCAKAALLEQRAIAGVGNYMADEALHRSGVSPHARQLSPDRALRLAGQVRAVALEALGSGGVSLRDYSHADGTPGAYGHRLLAYGRAGQPCAGCGEPLQRCVVSGRGTTWCPGCQS